MSYETLSNAVFSKKPEQLKKLIKEGMDVNVKPGNEYIWKKMKRYL
ncbi:MAG: hypothetical protein JXB88_27045 [Spirochaetales bacterium]|nr:hypothetical protein [Spirochaetales bacterium]